MAFDRFLIAPLNSGFQNNVKPWLTPDDSFELLQNAHVFRGRVTKRVGSLWMGSSSLTSRFRIQVGTTDASGNISAFIPRAGNVPFVQGAIGQSFSIGTDVFTVNATGTPATLLSTNPAVTLATFDTSTGAAGSGQVIINGSIALTPVYWYPSLPVMGLDQYESGSINNHPSYGFDTTFAYVYNNGWNRSGTGSAPIWRDPSGNQANYFWVANWQGLTANTTAMFVTNFQVTNYNGAATATDDPIWTTQDGATWATFRPVTVTNPAVPTTVTNYIVTARIIVAFKERLVLLNTVENNGTLAVPATNANYVARCRFSHVGNPFAANAFLEPNVVYDPGTGNVTYDGGGFIDAPTEEKIVSAEFIKDRLIVYFERSCWELAYTGNQILPFVWQKINTELGSQSTFSTVPFDTEVLTIGNTGVHACNGVNVQRIDQKIPDEIFEFNAQDHAVSRTCGIRNYYDELVFWAFVSDDQEPTQSFPDQILVYNYQNQSWAVYDDCMTAFGYFEQQQQTTWASSVPQTWQTFGGSWLADINQANQRQIIAGNTQGYTFRLVRDCPTNASVLQVTDISADAGGVLTLTVINHNLTSINEAYDDDYDFVRITGVVANTATQDFLNGTIFPVWDVIDEDTIQINTYGGITTTILDGSYVGGGLLARVSNVQIKTKQFNPYVDKDRNVHLYKVNFQVSKTDAGAIAVDYFASSSEVSLVSGGQQNGSILGNNILETSAYSADYAPLEQYQERLFHPVYFQGNGEFIQLVLYFTADQMINPNVSLSPFELHSMTLFTKATSDRLE